MHEYAHSELNVYNWNLYITRQETNIIEFNVLKMSNISSLSHDSHPCNVCIDHQLTQHFSSHVHSRACQMWCDVINTARLCGDFTSYPLKSVYLSGGEPWKSKTGEEQDVIAAAIVVWFQRIAIVCTDAISCCRKHNRRVASRRGVELNHCCSMSFRGTHGWQTASGGHWRTLATCI